MGINITTTKVIERKAWGPKEFADSTGLSLPFVRKEIREGGILAVKAGRRWLISNVEMERYLARGSRRLKPATNEQQTICEIEPTQI